MRKKLNLQKMLVKSFVTTFEKGTEATLKGGNYDANQRKGKILILTDPKGTNYNTCPRTKVEYEKNVSNACGTS